MSERTSNIKDAVKDTARDVNKATSDAQSDISADLSALGGDMTRLAEQVAAILAAKGNTAFQSARSSVEGVAGEAREAVGEVADTFTDAIDESLETRPYTTLAITLGVGFLLGAIWRR